MDFHRRPLARLGGRMDFHRLPGSRWEERAAALHEARRMTAKSRVLRGCRGETLLLTMEWWLSLRVDKGSQLEIPPGSCQSRLT